MRDARVLVLRGGAIGDFVLTLPVFEAIRSRWPAGHLEVATYPRTGRLAVAAGCVHAFRSLEEPDFSRLFAYRTEFSPAFRAYVADFDVVVNLLYDPDGLVPARLREAGARQVLSLDPRPSGLIHAADHLVSVLHPLALFVKPAIPRLPFKRTLNPHAEIVLHPGSGSARKNWPLPRFLETARRLADSGREVRLVAGEAEEPLLPELEAAGLPLLRDVPLAFLCEHLASARLFIGNDSGITHLAAAVGIPVLALFGPTDPRVWGPRGDELIQVLRLGSDLDSIPVDLVLECVQNALG